MDKREVICAVLIFVVAFLCTFPSFLAGFYWGGGVRPTAKKNNRSTRLIREYSRKHATLPGFLPIGTKIASPKYQERLTPEKKFVAVPIFWDVQHACERFLAGESDWEEFLAVYLRADAEEREKWQKYQAYRGR